MELQFTSTEAAKILNIPFYRFQDWMRRGFIEPGFLSTGQGKKGLFDIPDLYAIRFFEKVLSHGWNRKVAAQFHGLFLATVKPVYFTNRKIFRRWYKFGGDSFIRITKLEVKEGDEVREELQLNVGIDLLSDDARQSLTLPCYDREFGQNTSEQIQQAVSIKAIWAINISDIFKEVDARLKELGYPMVPDRLYNDEVVRNEIQQDPTGQGKA